MMVPWYDAGQMDSLKNFQTLFPNYLHLKSNINFLNDLWKKFYFLIPVFIVITIFYFRNKRYLKLFLCYSFVFGFLSLINITHPQADGLFMESMDLVLSIFVLVPLMFDVWPRISFPLQVSVLAVIISARIISLQQAHIPWSQRLAWEKKLLEKTENLPQKKIIIDEKEVPLDVLKITWGTPYEIWLLSSIESNETRSVLVTENPADFDSVMKNNKCFIGKWKNYDYDQLPARYFSFHDTTYYTFYHPNL